MLLFASLMFINVFMNWGATVSVSASPTQKTKLNWNAISPITRKSPFTIQGTRQGVTISYPPLHPSFGTSPPHGPVTTLWRQVWVLTVPWSMPTKFPDFRVKLNLYSATVQGLSPISHPCHCLHHCTVTRHHPTLLSTAYRNIHSGVGRINQILLLLCLHLQRLKAKAGACVYILAS